MYKQIPIIFWTIIKTMLGRPDYSEIIPGLFLGNIETTRDKLFLHRNNIHYVLSLTRNPVKFDKDDKIIHIQIPLRDAPYEDIISYFDVLHNFIHEGLNNDKGVYVHCDMGISRSSTAIISYLMRLWDKPFAQVRAFVKIRRPQINPNFGFQTQLMLFDKLGHKLTGSSRFHHLYERFLMKDYMTGEQRFDVRNYLKQLDNTIDRGTTTLMPAAPYISGRSSTTVAPPLQGRVEFATINDPAYVMPTRTRHRYHWPRLN